ncbi:aminotransferase class IV [Staphylococcus carnosus]|uniref:4-amino-4-deoxychorismate lyase n=1 Tax=Staphylococcus carnosus (strain TM300) TaxID=396513 RepID=B9DK44_STACT|nr:aminotransferase class IV [Staphylococcus carnosus]ANZ34005.1 aminodeoxychorismate lyase [Staphylococcus carnosus]QPT03460.1 aminotransferase class IV [Staphylococcus carnosus]UQA66183.1 aminotransferase class IV [Staphylococcus carnosus]UTB78979.1 aminodeoxychorismate lyase [Staphylococcus carnosus]UTB81367.1 aminodeoxychorismate lyase [Staphylococcus carnosus]
MYLFETMRVEAGDIPRNIYHTKRIANSAEQLNFQFNKKEWDNYLDNICQQHTEGLWRLKVMLGQDGTLTHQIVKLPDKQQFSARFECIDAQFPDWQYTNKTSEREHVTHDHETDTVLYYDTNGKILEFDIGNVVVEESGNWYTPPFENDFLKGCMRQALLDEGKLQLRSYQLDELNEKLKRGRAQIFLINSLREVADIQINL